MSLELMIFFTFFTLISVNCMLGEVRITNRRADAVSAIAIAIAIASAMDQYYYNAISEDIAGKIICLFPPRILSNRDLYPNIWRTSHYVLLSDSDAHLL